MSKVPDDYRQVAYTIMKGKSTIAVFTPEATQEEISAICAVLNENNESLDSED